MTQEQSQLQKDIARYGNPIIYQGYTILIEDLGCDRGCFWRIYSEKGELIVKPQDIGEDSIEKAKIYAMRLIDEMIEDAKPDPLVQAIENFLKVVIQHEDIQQKK